MSTQKITPNLWFDQNAEEAVNFYTSIFDRGQIFSTSHYSKAGFDVHHMPEGTVMTISFQLENLRFLALNGGPVFKFTPAISFMVHCPTTEEVNQLWAKLIEGGKALMEINKYDFSERYGWLADKFGLTWQIIHTPNITERSIVPSLMFANTMAGHAEEAINLYTNLFPGSSIGMLARYGAGHEPDAPNSLMYADFTLAGQKFVAMDSAHAHEFTFNEAISLIVNCADQTEIDKYWEALSFAPEAEQCGWLKDKFGVSWQIFPSGMEKYLNNADPTKATATMNAVMQMKKFDLAKLEDAAK